MKEVEEILKINFPKVHRGDSLEGGIVLSVIGGYFCPEFEEINIRQGENLVTLLRNRRGEFYVWKKRSIN